MTIRLLAILCVASLFSVSCGGSENILIQVIADFQGDQPPTDGSVTMQPGNQMDETFTVQVVVGGVDDFFGSSFQVSYDRGVMIFSGWSCDGTFLLEGLPVQACTGGDAFFQVDATSQPGKLLVAATRLDASKGGVTIPSGETRVLLTLTFRLFAQVENSPIDFIAPPTAPREVRNSVQPPPEGNLIPMTWAGGKVSAL